MNCPSCHHEIPLSKNKIPLLLCPRCVAAQSYHAVLNTERQQISLILKGDCRVTLTKPYDQVKWHMALPSYRRRAWCGHELNPRWKTNRVAYPRMETATVCDSCLRVFEELAKGQPTEAA